jgi:dephospho-CoA kinase
MIIAVIGMPGCGKSEVINRLLKKGNFTKVYFGEVTFDEMKKRGLSINEQNERQIREEIRAKHGMGAYAKLSLPKIQELVKKGNNILIESLYSWEEYLIIKDYYPRTIFLAIYASPKTRYQRLAQRKKRSLQPDEVESRDHAQIVNLHQAGPIVMSDYTIVNDGNLGDLHTKIEGVLKEINGKKEKGF